MIEPKEDELDQLGLMAEVYEEMLDADPDDDVVLTGTPEFEAENPKLAKALRLLRTVFIQDSPQKAESGERRVSSQSQIGRFLVQSCLGSGSFGTVWRAHDPLLNREVAVKVAHTGAHASPSILERFEREAHLAARLHHPNIVPVFEFGEDNGQLYIVSEYCGGTSLQDWLRCNEAPLDPLLAARVVHQLADATEHAHQRGLIHRDIKPANVLLTDHAAQVSQLVPRLTDFGLARDMTSETSSTRTGEVLGTVTYMAPEQAIGEASSLGPETDVYSLGVLLYELLTGTTPFTGSSDFEVIQQTVTAEPVAPLRRRREVPPDLNSICLKCLEKRPEQRYSTAAHLRDDLDRFLRNEPTVARPIPATERLIRWARRSPSAAALILVSLTSLLVIVAGMGIYLRSVQESARDLALALTVSQRARDDADVARSLAEQQREMARQVSYLSDMRLAFDLWDRGQVHDVRRLLSGQVAGNYRDLRGPEWFVLNADVNAQYREVGRHQGAVTECLMSHDGESVYSVGVDGYVRQWDLWTGEMMLSCDARMGPLHALALSPDGSTLAIGGETQLPADTSCVMLIDAATGEHQTVLQTHSTTIESIEYSPDSRWLAAGSRYESVQLTRMHDSETFTLKAERRNRAVSFSFDSRFLSIAASEDSVDVWSLDEETPVYLHSIPGYKGGHPYVARLMAGLPRVGTAYSNHRYVTVTDLTTKQLMAVLGTTKPGDVVCLGSSPDGRLMAAGDSAGEIRLWESDRFRQTADDSPWNDSDSAVVPSFAAAPHRSRTTSVSVTSNGNVITSAEDGRVALTTPGASGGSRTRLTGITVQSATLDGGSVLLGCADGTIRRHVIDQSHRTLSQPQMSSDSLRERPAREPLVETPDGVFAVAVSRDGQLIAAGTEDGAVLVYGSKTGSLVRSLEQKAAAGTDSAVLALSFAENGEWLAWTGRREVLKVQNIRTGAEVLSAKPGSGWSLCFLPGEDRIVCGGRFEGIRTFDLDSTAEGQILPGDSTRSLAASGDGHRLLSAQENGTIQLMELLPSGRTFSIPGHRGSVKSAVFAASGATAISLDNQGVLQFTDCATGTVIGHLKLAGFQRSDSPVCHQVLCRDDLLVVVIGYENTPVADVYTWELNGLMKAPADAPESFKAGGGQ